MLARVHSAYPSRLTRSEGIPANLIRNHPLPYLTARATQSVFGADRSQVVERWATRTLARRMTSAVRPGEVFTAMSSIGLEPGLRAQQLGGYFITRRGSSHILRQRELLDSEAEVWGGKPPIIDEWVIDRELREYGAADLIEVPSTFAAETFTRAGVPYDRLLIAPLGVNLDRFSGTPRAPSSTFNVLYVGQVSLRKGVLYLLQAFSRVLHPKKSLRIVGSMSDGFTDLIRRHRIPLDGVEFVDAMPQSSLENEYRWADLFVLPSIEDGFGMVMAQAMACGAPVLATTNSGARDILDEGSGLVVEAGSADALFEQMQQMADDVEARSSLSRGALRRVAELNGWQAYGEAFKAGLARLRRSR